MLTLAQFRTDFAEFASEPDALVTFWLNVATVQVQNADRWGTLLTTAQELVTAHYVVLAARDLAAAALGGVPGSVTGLIASESVADLAQAYDVSAVLLAGGGLWNQTTYGQRYFSLARMIGAGGMQLPFACWPPPCTPPLCSSTTSAVGHPPYQQAFTSQTSITIPAATHGQGANVTVHVYQSTLANEADPAVLVDAFGNVTILFGAAYTGDYSIAGYGVNGAPNYSLPFTNQATVVIPASMHGFTTGVLDVAAYDTGGNEFDPAIAIDNSNNVTLTFGFAYSGRAVISTSA